MIKIPNVPCLYVADFPTKIDFILLHKLLDNPHYRNYYIKNKNDGKYKILDNSAFELEKGLNDDLLIEWADKINANEIIIPDIYGNKEETVLLMNNFIKKHPDCPYNLQSVPQGKNREELIDCCSIMLQESRIYCIGLNKLWNREGERKSDLEYMIEIIHSVGKEIHMLGVKNLSDWYHPATKYARSGDSRILTKIVTGKEDIWEEKLDEEQMNILQRLIGEIEGNKHD